MLIENIASSLPLWALDHAAYLVENIDPLAGCLGALAVRATEHGNMDLALHLLDQKGNNRSSQDQTLARVYQIAPKSWIPTLIARAEKFYPIDRAATLVELLDRVPRQQRAALVKLIVEDTASLVLDAFAKPNVWYHRGADRLRKLRGALCCVIAMSQ